MILLLSFLLGTASATDRSRMRSFYKHACQSALAIPPGLKIVTGAVLNKTATENEYDLGVRRLAERVQTVPVGRHDFAAYLFALATGPGSWNHAEEFFFDYLARPRNESLAGRLVPEMLEILRGNLQYPGTGHQALTWRWRFAIDILRGRANHAVVPWTEFVDELLMGEEPAFGSAVENLSQPEHPASAITPETLMLCGEFNRPAATSVAELEWDRVPTFISVLRLDRWVRAAAGLPGRDRLADILDHLFELSRPCTKH